MTDEAAVDLLPVTIIGGYLGSGKTTLVNRLLREAGGLRLAVLVNEFGELPIDKDLIESIDDNIISIAGGCVCCSYGNDLVMAMIDLAKMVPRPNHVLLETSGVALPGAIAASVDLLQGYTTSGVIVLADAETVRERAADRYMSDTVERQLDAADIIVLNKIDLVSSSSSDAIHSWLAQHFVHARIVTATHAELPPAIVLDGLVGHGRDGYAASHHQVDVFETATITLAAGIDATRLAKRLAEPELGLLRAKGFVTVHDGSSVTIQVVGGRWNVSPSAAPAHNGIVCIGPRSRVNHQALQQIKSDFGAA